MTGDMDLSPEFLRALAAEIENGEARGEFTIIHDGTSDRPEYLGETSDGSRMRLTARFPLSLLEIKVRRFTPPMMLVGEDNTRWVDTPLGYMPVRPMRVR